ncbi:hypothetical protein P4O66_010901, partial [Electrophorus voltai]
SGVFSSGVPEPEGRALTVPCVPAVLDQLLEELQHFLKLLDGEHLSGTAAVRKGLLAELLQAYKSSNGGDEEYIYMNKVIVTGQNHDKTDREHRAEAEANGRAAKPIFAPQKSLPELPLPRTVSDSHFTTAGQSKKLEEDPNAL